MNRELEKGGELNQIPTANTNGASYKEQIRHEASTTILGNCHERQALVSPIL